MQASNRSNITSAKENGFASGFKLPDWGQRNGSVKLEKQARYWESFFSSPDIQNHTLGQTSSNLEPSNENPKAQSRTVRSKRVPGLSVYTRNDETTATVVEGPYVTYCYRSSLSTRGTPHGFGAIGDGRPPSSSLRPISNGSTAVSDNSLGPLDGEVVIKKSPISELFPETTPERKPYSLISLNRRPKTRLADLPLITPSDLLPHSIRRQPSSSSLRPLSYLQTEMPHEIGNDSRHHEAKTLGAIPKSNGPPPVWERKGMPFSFTLCSAIGDAVSVNRIDAKDDLDPNTFVMPTGVSHALTTFTKAHVNDLYLQSAVIMVRSHSIEDLLLSVKDGVWNPSRTASEHLHWAWCARKEHEMVLVLFTLNSRYGWIRIVQYNYH